MEGVESLVCDLETLKETYFGADKNDQIEAAIAQIEEALEPLMEGASGRDLGALASLQGRALNCRDAYDAGAEKALTRAMKLVPDSVVTWNMLGETYWKKGDLENAKACFEGGLEVEENAVSLCRLSMVERATPVSAAPEKMALVSSSLGHAKRAVALDVTDGASWYNMGNALTTSFFFNTQDVAELASALKAYKRAETSGSAGNPDLWYNRAEVFKYLEQYTDALAGFRRAATLDPQFAEATVQAERVVHEVRQVTTMIEKKCHIKPKKLAKMVKDLTPLITVIKRERLPFARLLPGPNHASAVVGRIIAVIERANDIPQTFVVVDEETTCFAISIYNMQKGALSKGDELWIPDPFLMPVDLNENATITVDDAQQPASAQPSTADADSPPVVTTTSATSSPDAPDTPDAPDGDDAASVIGYPSIRIDTPSLLWINGSPARNVFLRSTISVSAVPE